MISYIPLHVRMDKCRCLLGTNPAQVENDNEYKKKILKNPMLSGIVD